MLRIAAALLNDQITLKCRLNYIQFNLCKQIYQISLLCAQKHSPEVWIYPISQNREGTGATEILILTMLYTEIQISLK